MKAQELKTDSNFEGVQDALKNKNEETNRLELDSSFESEETEHNTGVRKESQKNQIDVDFKNNKNYIPKEKFFNTKTTTQQVESQNPNRTIRINIRDDQTNQNLVQVNQTNQNLVHDDQTNQNIVHDDQTNQNIVQDNQTNQNIVQDDQMNQSLFQDNLTNLSFGNFNFYPNNQWILYDTIRLNNYKKLYVYVSPFNYMINLVDHPIGSVGYNVNTNTNYFPDVNSAYKFLYDYYLMKYWFITNCLDT